MFLGFVFFTRKNLLLQIKPYGQAHFGQLWSCYINLFKAALE